jgi:dihydrofolate synthase/folylpolyglutamate synthase
MVGFLEFQRAKCDYVVLECGLGGKLDATNIIEAPELIISSIASIGFDHTDVLGETLDEIAEEKAGVIKSGVPCVVGHTCT